MRQLYHTMLSPFCRKVRLALAEKELTFELLEENPWDKRLDFFALNPAGEVPVLIEENGCVFSGNYAICEYIEDAYPTPTLLGKSPIIRAEVRRLVDWFDHKFDFEVTQKLVFEKVLKRFMHGGAPDSTAIRKGRDNILYHLDYIGYLASERYFLAGEYVSMADLAAAAHLSALDYLGDVPWHYNAAAQNWYAIMKSRPGMRIMLKERLSILAPPAHYENPDF